MSDDLQTRIKEKICAALPDAQVMVHDPLDDGAHFEATVISETFTGMPLAQQHRQVMGPLKELLAGEVHALALKTYTPEKWAAKQG